MNKFHILTLMLTPKIGRKTVKKVIDAVQFEPTGIEDLHGLIKTVKENNSRIILPTMDQLKNAQLNAENIIFKTDNLGVKIISFTDSDFPQRLKIIADPPVLLYAKGDISCLNSDHSIAVIGTRQPTKYGRDMAECFGMLLGEKGIVVVSGLALGCDTAAHQGCINTGGKTVAVLANGLDTIYPKQNTALAEQILENNGCLISEYPPGARIMSNYFVERDRLQSGLSKAVIIVETDLKGGTMHTFKYAVEQNKIIACLDHSEKLESNKSKGNKKLIKDRKAYSVKDLKDFEVLINKVMNHSQVGRQNQSSVNSVDIHKQITFPIGEGDEKMG